MQGSRKLQDLLVDAKVPAEERAHLPVLVVGNEVVWVPGYRVAQAFAVRTPGACSVWVRMANV
jgi:tRNA(Ile)-lysidine synthase